jgi:hypothetical protein
MTTGEEGGREDRYCVLVPGQEARASGADDAAEKRKSGGGGGGGGGGLFRYVWRIFACVHGVGLGLRLVGLDFGVL